MNRRWVSRIVLCLVVIAAGLGLGYGIPRWAGRPSPSNGEPTPADNSRKGNGLIQQPDDSGPQAATKTGKRALLVGVTKYDHLPAALHLTGPGNDVRLMRRLLMDRFGFPAEAIVTLSEEEGRPDRRPTRANIERAFRRLAEQAREGDQVVILLAGHGARQPEKEPPDPKYPEPDGIDEIFLPADVACWKGYPAQVPNAIIDDQIGVWLEAITAKKAYVWITFDCCHSGTMTRGTEVVRELPPGLLVPEQELEKARQKAARQGRTRGEPITKPAPFVAREPSDYLVALYACRSHETTPESPQPPDSPDAQYHGLLTWSLVGILSKSATSKAPLTYRELVQRIQTQYAGRPQGSPTPTIEGRGQDRVVLGTDQPARPRLLLSRNGRGYKVNAGDLYGLTPGSVLAVYSPAGTNTEPKPLGHVRVRAVRPFEATVEPCEYEKSPVPKVLLPFSTCKPVYIDYGLRRFKVAVMVPEGHAETRQRLVKALAPVAGAKEGLVDLVQDPRKAEWLVRLDKGKVQLAEASGNRAPFALPGPDSPDLAATLRDNLGRVFRARNLLALASRFEAERYRGGAIPRGIGGERPLESGVKQVTDADFKDEATVDVEVQVLRHKGPEALGEVLPPSAGGWVFRPGDFISFRVKNNSPSLQVDVTLLIVGADFQIRSFYPIQDEPSKSLRPGKSLDTLPPGEINDETPPGPECLVVIATPARNPPADFGALAQDGLAQARAVDKGGSLRSPLGELLECALYRSGSRCGLPRSVAAQHGMRLLTWRAEPK